MAFYNDPLAAYNQKLEEIRKKKALKPTVGSAVQSAINAPKVIAAVPKTREDIQGIRSAVKDIPVVAQQQQRASIIDYAVGQNKKINPLAGGTPAPNVPQIQPTNQYTGVGPKMSNFQNAEEQKKADAFRRASEELGASKYWRDFGQSMGTASQGPLEALQSAGTAARAGFASGVASFPEMVMTGITSILDQSKNNYVEWANARYKAGLMSKKERDQLVQNEKDDVITNSLIAVRDTIRDFQSFNQESSRDKRMPAVTDISYNTSQGVGNLASQAAATYVAGPSAGLNAMIFGQYGQGYEQARNNGLSPTQAMLTGLAQAGVTGLTERYGLFQNLDKVTGRLGTDTKNAFLREGFQEFFEQTGQNVVQKVAYDPTKSIMEGSIEAGIYGGLSAAPYGGATSLLQSAGAQLPSFNQEIETFTKSLVDSGVKPSIAKIISGQVLKDVQTAISERVNDPAYVAALRGDKMTSGPDFNAIRAAEVARQNNVDVSLVQEAQKYKTAEDFIRAKTENTPIPQKAPIEQEQVGKYRRTLDLNSKEDFEYLKSIFSEERLERFKNGDFSDWRGNGKDYVESIVNANIISGKPKTQAELLEGRVNKYNLDTNTLYHGTRSDNLAKIIESGFVRGSDLPAEAFRGGGHGSMQDSISFSTDPKIAATFASTSPEGSILEVKLKPGANVVTVDGVDYAEDLNDSIETLKGQGIDAVYLAGEKEVVVIDPSSVTQTGKNTTFKAIDTSKIDFEKIFPKSDYKQELRTIWNQANQGGQVLEPINMGTIQTAMNMMKQNDAGAVGTLGDFFQSQKLREIFKDVLDVEVMVLDKSMTKKETLAGYDPNRKMVVLPAGNQTAIDRLMPSLVEEALHAMRDNKGRLSKDAVREIGTVTDENFISKYLASKDEQIAKKGVDQIMQIVMQELRDSKRTQPQAGSTSFNSGVPFANIFKAEQQYRAKQGVDQGQSEGMKPGAIQEAGQKASEEIMRWMSEGTQEIAGSKEGKAGNVKLKNFEASNMARETILRESEKISREEAVGQPVSSDQARREARALAEDVGISVQQVQQWAKESADNRSKLIAAKSLLSKLTEDIAKQRVEVRANPGNEQAKQRMTDMVEEYQKALAATQRIIAETGRALGANKVKGLMEGAQDIEQYLKSDKKLSPEAMAHLLWSTEDADLQRVIRDIPSPSIWSRWYSVSQASLLSGWKTQERNILGNIGARMVMKLQKPFDQIGRRAADILGAEDLDLSFKDTLLFGTKELRRNISKEAIEAVVNFSNTKYEGAPTFTPTKIEQAAQVVFDFMEWGDRAIGKVPLAKEAAIVEARRIANQEGLKGKAKQDRVMELVKEPTPEMIKVMIDKAFYGTFQNKPDSKIYEGLSKMRNNVFGKLAVPFFRTVYNIGSFAVDRVVIGQPVNIYKGIKGKQSVAQTISNLSFSLATMIAVGAAFEMGLITDEFDDEEKDLRYARGEQPKSINIFGQSFSYKGFEPVSMLLDMQLSAYQAIKGLATGEMDAGEAFEEGVASPWFAFIQDNPFMSGISGLAEIFNPTYGRSELEMAEKYAWNQVTRFFLPGSGMLRNINEITSGGERKSYEYGTWEGVAASIPFLSNMFEARRNHITGEKITKKPNITITGDDTFDDVISTIAMALNPSTASTPKDEAVIAEMLRIGYQPSAPQKKYNGVEIPEKDYDTYVKESGSNAYARLKDIIGSPEYEALTDASKEYVIKQVYSEERADARATIIEGIEEARLEQTAEGKKMSPLEKREYMRDILEVKAPKEEVPAEEQNAKLIKKAYNQDLKYVREEQIRDVITRGKNAGASPEVIFGKLKPADDAYMRQQEEPGKELDYDTFMKFYNEVVQ